MVIYKLDISPTVLDAQATIKVDRWLDLDSEECRAKDDDHALTKKWLKIGMDAKFLFADPSGRIWGRGENNIYFPYHFNVGKTLYGYRISKSASN